MDIATFAGEFEATKLLRDLRSKATKDALDVDRLLVILMRRSVLLAAPGAPKLGGELLWAPDLNGRIPGLAGCDGVSK